MYGSDQSASVEPHGFIQLTGAVRKIELALGDGTKKILKDEKIRSDLKENAKDIVALNQGSTDTQVSYILNILGAKY